MSPFPDSLGTKVDGQSRNVNLGFEPIQNQVVMRLSADGFGPLIKIGQALRRVRSSLVSDARSMSHVFFGTVLGVGILTSPSVAVFAEEAKPYFFRLDYRYEYLGTPVRLDVVVACRARISSPLGGGQSVFVTQAPDLFGLRMPDGGGLVVRTPDFCSGGTTDNGFVPQAFMPAVMTVENADKPFFAKAYVTEDAYSRPSSKLKFLSASVHAATQDDFAAWRRDVSPSNIVTKDLVPFPIGNPFEKPQRAFVHGKGYFPTSCYSATKYPMPPEIRDRIPSGSAREGLWHDSSVEYLLWGPRAIMFKPVSGRETPDRRGVKWTDLFGAPAIAGGVFRTGEEGGAVPNYVRFFRPERKADIFPVITDLNYGPAAPLSEGGVIGSGKPDPVMFEVVEAEDKKGFAYCYPDQTEFSGGPRFEKMLTGLEVLVLDEAVVFKEDWKRSTYSTGNTYFYRNTNSIYLLNKFYLTGSFGGL